MNESGSVFQAAAIVILATVGRGAQKLTQDVAMRPMDLDAVIPRPLTANGRRNEIVPQLVHLVQTPGT